MFMVVYKKYTISSKISRYTFLFVNKIVIAKRIFRWWTFISIIRTRSIIITGF